MGEGGGGETKEEEEEEEDVTERRGEMSECHIPYAWYADFSAAQSYIPISPKHLRPKRRCRHRNQYSYGTSTASTVELL